MTDHIIQDSTGNVVLDALARKVRADLHTLRYPHDPWVVEHRHASGRHVYDVVIIGAGQGGLAVTAGLLRERVENIIAFDRRDAGLEGPWSTTARMPTLRTLKHLPGIDPSLPNLSPQAWYVARHGQRAWEAIDRISKADWQDYLTWCRGTLNLPVRNRVEVSSIVPTGELFRLNITELNRNGDVDNRDFVYARRVVLATGIDGGGGWHVPQFIASALPNDRYASSGDAIDFSQLADKRVAVLGAGASAFDNASTALEAGARTATVCIRRDEIQRVNPQMWMAKAGFLSHYADLHDSQKWQFMRHMFRFNIPAPQSAYERLSALPGASVRSNASWHAVELVASGNGKEILVRTAAGDSLQVDFLIVAIGFTQDFKLRPELANFSQHIALWRDRFSPPTDEFDAHAGSHPYLGDNFEFTETNPGDAPYLSRIFNFTYSAIVSMGLSGSAISGFRYSVPRVVRGVTKSLFVEDADKFASHFADYAEPEMLGTVPFTNPPQNSESES